MSLSSQLNRVTTAFRPWKKTQPADAPSWIGYSSCDELPFCKFIACLADARYEELTISGTYSPEQAHVRWLKLYSEYCTRTKNEVMYTTVMQMGHIEALWGRIEVCKRLVMQLYTGPNEVFEECLKNWGYRLKYDTPQQRKKELDRVVTLLRGEEERLNTMMEPFIEKAKDKDPAKERQLMIDTFNLNMAALTKFMGVSVRLNDPDLTVGLYCNYLNYMNEYNEASKKAAHAG